MRIPLHWAEGRIQQRRDGRGSRQVTVSRWGWSDESVTDAQRHADERTREAFERILAGDDAPRREPKAAYNGAEGVPIREEIIGRHGSTVITRNSYGSLCLNTPDVLFTDIDFPTKPGCLITGLGSLAQALVVGTAFYITGMGAFSLVAAMVALVAGSWSINHLIHFYHESQGGIEQIARKRVEQFAASHPEWHLRLYRTPAGMRVMAVHDLFEPNSEDAQDFFRCLASDPVYVAMCRRQACFRARVSPKPWRIGMSRHIKPRTAVWPIAPEKVPARDAWIAEYNAAARGYASCRYLESLGTASTNPQAQEVQRIHDELCRATSGLPIA